MENIFNTQKEIVVTLFEKHYHLGVASLINSLHHSNFIGLVHIGYRGELPYWTSQLEQISPENFKLSENISISFEKVNIDMHFTYYKPKFMRKTLENFPEATNIYYFDPDIVVKAPWKFINTWTNNGISLCVDLCYPYVHHNHPWRDAWRKLSGSSAFNKFDYYVNAGYVGIKSSETEFLDRWIDLIDKFKLSGGDLLSYNQDGFNSFKGDQDLLNGVITISPDIEFSIIGTEGMGFTNPGYLMSHAVSDVKPWKKNYLKFLVSRGKRPDFSDKDYMKFANSPISVYSYPNFKIRKINMKLASIFGRVFGT